MLGEFYETLLRMFNHYSGDNYRPLASVALHPQEDVITDSLLERSIKTFVLRNVKDTFGLNYLEYISLPSYICEMMSNVGQDSIQRKASAAAEVEKELNSLQP